LTCQCQWLPQPAVSPFVCPPCQPGRGDEEAGASTPGAASKLKAGLAAVVSTKVLVSGFLSEKAGVVKAALPVALGGSETPAVEEETYCGLTRCLGRVCVRESVCVCGCMCECVYV
jgi:hypothetical protein